MLCIIKFEPAAIDQYAIIISIVGYSIVFIALVTLYLIFFNLPKLFDFVRKIRHRNKEEEIRTQYHETLTGEVNAAISMALFLYLNEIHDEESRIMTMERVSRTYSPWSSKIYAVRNYFNRL